MKIQKTPAQCIAQNLRKLRENKQMSIQSLVKASSVSRRTIVEIEKGHGNPAIETLERLAGALECDFFSLVAPNFDDDFVDFNEEAFSQEEERIMDERTEYTNIEYGARVHDCYYPPLLSSHRISSMLELVVVWPLLDLCVLSDSLCRFRGEVINYEEYVSKQIEYCFDRVPDSLAKRYAEKQLHAIAEIRKGNTDYELSSDEETRAEYDAYVRIVSEKKKYIDDLDLVMSESRFSNLFFSAN